jgi:hypothetical protein
MVKGLDTFIGFKIKLLDCGIGRRRIAIRLPPSSHAKKFILKPVEGSTHVLSIFNMHPYIDHLP